MTRMGSEGRALCREKNYQHAVQCEEIKSCENQTLSLPHFADCATFYPLNHLALVPQWTDRVENIRVN